MGNMLADAALVLLFILLGGVFAAAEIALVSLRPAQVASLPDRGAGGRAASRLLSDPNRFLSAVQIGVTLAALLSSAFGAVSFAARLEPVLVDAGLTPGLSATLSVLLVTLVIAYLSLVIGELTPKRLALARSEQIAILTAPLLQAIAIGVRPVIWFLGRSTDAMIFLLGARHGGADETGADEELRHAVATNDTLSPEERRLLTDVLESGHRPMREIMIPRLDVDVLSAELSLSQALDVVHDRPHSRYPIVESSLDDVVGFIHVRDLMGRSPDDPRTLADMARPLLEIPESRQVLPALAEFRSSGNHMALVVDEYGGGAGIVTLEDLIEELVGDITDEFDLAGGGADTAGEDHDDDTDRPLPSEAVDAQLRLAEFAEVTGVDLPEGSYDTAAGWVLWQLGKIPVVGDVAHHDDVLITVDAMRGNRIEAVRLSTATSTGDH